MQVSESVFSVPPVIESRDMANPEVGHIGIMAYAVWHRNANALPATVQVETSVHVALAPLPVTGIPADCYATVVSVLRANVEGYINVRVYRKT